MDTSSLTQARRWLTILPLLKTPFPIEELAQRCGVSTRQINRDIRNLREAGLRIEIREKKAFFAEGASANDFAISRLFASEFAFLKKIADLLGIASLTETVNAFAQSMPEIDTAPSLPIITSQTRLNIDEDQRRALKLLMRAIQHRHITRFNYTDKNGTASIRTVHPVQLILHEGSPYLQAFDTDRNAWRVFRLANIDELNLTPTTFPTYPAEIVQRVLAHSPSRLFIGPTETIAVRFTGNAIHQARASHLVCAAVSKVETEHGLTAELEISNRNECFRWLLGFGLNAEIIGPPEMRAEYADFALAIAEHHRAPTPTHANSTHTKALA
jgi:predicted DNA-binding transcriptional regulator YafY